MAKGSLNSKQKDAYNVDLDVFTGPFHVLYHLIEKHKIDIYDIPIVKLTNGYIDFISKMDFLNLEMASDFLVMASRLMEIKTRMLLPSKTEEKEEEDPREELSNRLAEYRKYRYLARYLVELKKKESQYYKKGFQKKDPPAKKVVSIEGLNMKDLHLAFIGLLKAVKEREPEEIERKKSTFKERMTALKKELARGKPISFNKLFLEKNITRVEIIFSFLAVLDLAMKGSVSLIQPEVFGDILITPNTTEEMVVNETG